ncbi:VOC family protein [Pleurocapsa sp. FMAR1]|uniref:hypothetical protein n=1 Tax=Pleurocapsa sp. FMAR1 TaxID=3040204 RepID=UPI0029C85CBA|nr:hypothetical protein [Pleurocapsa sp. FMAR1]
MKKLHLAISTNDIKATIKDYSKRLSAKPCLVISGEYALWRTETLNVSIRQDSSCQPGELRHLGWEDSTALSMSVETDVNGIVWENFTASQQAEEINEIWSKANYQPES